MNLLVLTLFFALGVLGQEKPLNEAKVEGRNLNAEYQIFNETNLEDILTSIINSGRNGRSSEEYGEIFSDSKVQEALQRGDDQEARNLVKEKLCNLGLMQCDEQFPSMQRYISSNRPGIYPARPTFPGKFGPPRKVGYENGPFLDRPPSYIGNGNIAPSNSIPSLLAQNFHESHASTSFGDGSVVYSKPPPGAIIYGSKPPGPTFSAGNTPFEFEQPGEKLVSAEPHFSSSNNQYKLGSQFNSQPPNAGSVSQAASLQQHVHHHYHHVDPISAAKAQSQLIGGPIAQNTNSDYTTLVGIDATKYGSSANYGGLTGSSAYEVSSYGVPLQSAHNVKPVFENNQNSHQLFSSGFGSDPSSNGIYSGNYLKKELNLNNVNGLTNYAQQNKNYYGDKFSQESEIAYNQLSARQESLDCVCVPYEQCSIADRIGRKNDLILPLDPRNLGSKIEAEKDDGILLDGKNETKLTDDDASKKIAKRELQNPEEAINPTEEDSETQPRQLGGNGPYTSIGLSKKKVLPTFGVSFGLPYPTGVYPVNAFGGPPAVNSHFGAISPNGVNLGLLNVNPLFSLQVTKNEYGEKLVKPLVNLHLTPNELLIHKLGSLFAAKKELLYNKHEHVHTHTHYSDNPASFYPPSFEPTGPNVFNGPNYGYAGEYGYHPLVSGGNFREIPIEDHAISPHTSYFPNSYGEEFYETGFHQRSLNTSQSTNLGYEGSRRQSKFIHQNEGKTVVFPNARRRRNTVIYNPEKKAGRSAAEYTFSNMQKRRAYYGDRPLNSCNYDEVCCRRRIPKIGHDRNGQCGTRNAHGITGRIKNPVYVDGDSQFGEYPWQAAILKKDPKESIYVCGGTIIDQQHIITAAHCIKAYANTELRIRLGEWDVNHDVEFFPHIERDVIGVHIHPEYYAGTLDNDLAVLKLDRPIEFNVSPHISPACLPDKHADFTGSRCWTTGWGKDAFGDFGKYQNILKEVDVPVINQAQCQNQLRQTRLGYNYQLHPGFICAGGEEGKDACKGDGGGPMVCERNNRWQLVGVVSWGIGCGQTNVPGVYVRVSYYLDWINQITRHF